MKKELKFFALAILSFASIEGTAGLLFKLDTNSQKVITQAQNTQHLIAAKPKTKGSINDMYGDLIGIHLRSCD
ncbi:MAG TPA: hypothetical protein V6C96_04230 [Vampirovibrionales bacterium]